MPDTAAGRQYGAATSDGAAYDDEAEDVIICSGGDDQALTVARLWLALPIAPATEPVRCARATPT